MKTKIWTIILIVICLGLGGGLWYRHHTAVAKKRSDDDQIRHLLAQVEEQGRQLKAQIVANSNLTATIQAKSVDLENSLSQLSQTRGLLGKTEAEVKATREELESAKVMVSRRAGRIAELEGANTELERKANEMQAAIADLEVRIADTQRRLDTSEGNRSFLLKELKRLQAEKADLERRFSDLAELREQIKKTKKELVVSRRLDWMRRGLYGTAQKSGAELLQGGLRRQPHAPKPDVDLDVEIRRDGPATVAPSVQAPPGTTAPRP